MFGRHHNNLLKDIHLNNTQHCNKNATLSIKTLDPEQCYAEFLKSDIFAECCYSASRFFAEYCNERALFFVNITYYRGHH
jgi:hypothetical protein